MCFKKQQIQDVVACLLINSYFTFGHNICQIIGTPIGSNPAPFFCQIILIFLSKQVDEWIKEELSNQSKKTF